MISHKRWFCVIVPAVLALSACAGPVAVDSPSIASGGAIELAVSESCAEGSSSQCISVGGQSVVLPTEFDKAGVGSSSVVRDGGQNAVDVTFSDDGAKVFHSLTKQAADAGSTARLVIKIGDKIQAAVSVLEAMTSNDVRIILPAGDSPQKVLELIHGEG